MRPLIWFRRDLRVADNTALSEACRCADHGAVAAFVLTPRQWLDHDDAPCKIDFWLRNLSELSRSLDKLNVPLLVESVPRFDDIPQALLRLVEQAGCDALYFNHEYEVNERRRDDAAAAAFTMHGMPVHGFHDHVLLPPGEVRTQAGRWYTVFSPFKRSALTMLAKRGVEVRPRPRKQLTIPIRPSPLPDAIDGFNFKAARPDLWKAGEDHAQRRLATFVAQRLSDYKTKRDLPGINGTSTLSPYLAAGVLSPRQCIQAAVDTNRGRLDTGLVGATTWISELLWREFYVHILAAFPRVSMNRPFKLSTELLRWSDNDEHFRAWCAGRTGVPMVDAAMRQLLQTGWMHNRLRMIAAMYLVKDLFIDWRRGERHFMRHLIDGDLASNNGGWQWSASTGTDAAPYFRIFNPVSQSERFDPEGQFIHRFVPELAEVEGDAIHDPARLPALLRTRIDYSPPLVDHAQARQRTIAAFAALKAD